MKGRTAKDPLIDALHGKPGRRKKAAPTEDTRKDFFSAPRLPWDAPLWLGDRAKDVWAREIDTARRQARLQESQIPLFAAYCDALERFERYSVTLRAGETYTTPSGYRRLVPEVALRDKAAAEIKSLAAELMLSPKSWVSGMGTWAGRQLDLFRDPTAPPPPNQAAPPTPNDGLTQFRADRPALH